MPQIVRALFLYILFCAAIFGGSPGFYLHDGDTVVFYGDSITNQRLYTVFTEAYVLTRFPQLHIRFIHSGISGDRVSGGYGGTIDERLQRDVVAYHPTVVTIMLGMNDGEYGPYNAEVFNKYASGYRHIIEKLKEEMPGTRITVLEPSAYDDVTREPQFAGGYNQVLIQLGQFVREMAKSGHLLDADLNAPVVSLLRAAFQSAEPAQKLIPDRVHPSPGVHMVMAEALLQAWNAPSIVTSVEIDATRGVAKNARNTAVDSIDHSNGLSWTQTDRALPMPRDTPEETIDVALRRSDFTQALNQELLKIDGLATGKYRLRIDDDEIGVFDAGALGQGINLASMNTPMSRQAKIVLDLTHRHNHLHFARSMMVDQALREYKLAKTQAAMEALDNLEEEVVALQHATAQPKRHQYRLEAIPAH
jgi:lysophospholipase L1-like esterase